MPEHRIKPPSMIMKTPPLQLILALLLVCAFVPRAAAQTEAGDAALPALVELLNQVDDPEFHADVLKGMSDALKGRRGVKMPAGWEEVAAKLSQSPNPAVREMTQSLSVLFGSSAAFSSLREQLMDKQANLDARRGALNTLTAAKDPTLPPLLRRLLSDPPMRGPALRALAGYDDPSTPEAILDVYSSLTVAEKQDALATLLSRVPFARALLAGIAGEKIPAKDLTAEMVRQLRSLKNEQIDQEVEKIWGVARESDEDKKKEIARFKTMLTQTPPQPPNLSKGRDVYARVCLQCHVLFGEGGKVGPDLTGSNRADLDYILENIIDPNAVIPNDYRTSTLETTDERVITGIVTRQDNTAVTIVTANETLIVPRNEIHSLEVSDISMMPEGLLDQLGEQEIRDLIAYLASPTQAPLHARKDNLNAFFNGKDLTGWEGNFDLWSVENGEIVGKHSGIKKNEFLVAPLLLRDFRLIVQVKLVENKGNSGIQFRSEPLPNGSVKGYQADMGAGWWGKLYEEHGRALLWDKPGDAHVKAGDWNTYEILAVGNKTRTAINGKLCVDLDDPKGAREGIIAFQLHSGFGPMEVRFKDFQIEIDPVFELKTVR
jgi:putative heme-binding domain-containing protein